MHAEGSPTHEREQEAWIGLVSETRDHIGVRFL